MYCDEAGNTGPNYCDPKQPVFVAGALVVPNAAIPQCEAVVRESLRALNKAKRTSYSELKSSQLLGSSAGRERAANLLDDLCKLGAFPVFSALDKHFSLGARFVDEFLDVADNPHAGPEFCVEPELMRATATDIARLELPVLLAIEAAVRSPSVESRRDAAAIVATALKRAGNAKLAWIVEGFLHDPTGVTDRQAGRLAFPDYTRAMTPNVAGFGAVLVTSDVRARGLGATSLRVIHDDTPAFEKSLNHAYHLHSNPEAHALMESSPYSLSAPRAVISKSPEFLVSDDEPMLQAADVLSGNTVYILRLGQEKARLDTGSRRLATIAFRAVSEEGMASGGIVFSDDARDWIRGLVAQLDPDTRESASRALGLD
jgi:hypothetical protein